MRKILVKIHQIYGKGYCIGIGVVFLIFSICFLSFLYDPFFQKTNWGNLVLVAASLLIAILLFVASSNDYETLELPWYYTYDQYGRYVKTNGKETVVSEEAKKEKPVIELGIKTKADAEAALQSIEGLHKSKIISDEDYNRARRQLAVYLKDET